MPGAYMAKSNAVRLFFALLFTAAACVTAAGQAQQAGRIVGMVHVSRGDFPPHPLLVTLEFRGSTIGSVYTDSQGRFGFYDLGANPYHVKIADDDYNPVDESAVVNPAISPTTFVQVELIPKAAAKPQDPLADRVAGNNPYLVDPADYNRKFPKKAVKSFEHGVKADKNGKHDDAIHYYEEALAIAPDYYPACNNLGTDYLSKQDFTRAEVQFRKGMELNQNDAQSYFNLANVMLLTGRQVEAEVELQNGLKRRPDSAFGHFLQGSLYSQTNRPQLAEKALQEALQLDPTMSQVHLQLVNLYLKQKRTPDAISQLEAYLRAFPDTPLSEKARDLLKRLRADSPAVTR